MTQAEVAVELYEDGAGGLHIFREDSQSGFYMSGKVPGALFANDAKIVAGVGDATWQLDAPRTSRQEAQRVGAVHVATWEHGQVSVHYPPNSKTRMYLGGAG